GEQPPHRGFSCATGPSHREQGEASERPPVPALDTVEHRRVCFHDGSVRVRVAARTDEEVHGCGLVEQLLEEAFPATLVAIGAWGVGVVRSGRVGIVGARRVRIAVGVWSGVVHGWWRCPVRWRRRGRGRVVTLLSRHDLLQLSGVEEDASAPFTLVDVDTHTVEGAHTALALRTNHSAIVFGEGLPVSLADETRAGRHWPCRFSP